MKIIDEILNEYNRILPKGIVTEGENCRAFSKAFTSHKAVKKLSELKPIEGVEYVVHKEYTNTCRGVFYALIRHDDIFKNFTHYYKKDK